jgi:hypothetical protein
MGSEDRHPPQPRALAETAELLRRERPEMTVDEIDRLHRRLHPPSAQRRAPRVVVAFCLALGLVFTTAGTGLAISGFASSDEAVQAQYPDSAAGGPPSAPPGQQGGGQQPNGGSGAAGRPSASSAHGGHTQSRPPSLGDTARARHSADRLELSQAESRTAAPFTGYGAIPLLAAGIALFVTGAVRHRRARSR